MRRRCGPEWLDMSLAGQRQRERAGSFRIWEIGLSRIGLFLCACKSKDTLILEILLIQASYI